MDLELLAPAGSYDSMRAAVNAGCDAVYIGADRFGARAYADNLSVEDIISAIEYCHIRGVSLYLTLNTLIKDDEIQTALNDYVRPLYEHGLDAVIVQDLGIIECIKKQFPQLPIHGSTQMTTMNKQSAQFLKEQGVSRVVLARELSLEEISSIHKEVDIELECFIHGALCYSYSGQCLLSSIIGGRSGNRGRCAGTCRLPYSVIEDQKQIIDHKYILSLKELCTIYKIPDLIRLGIHSFKIEGRMKRPEYVAGVVSIYRKYMDKYLRNPNERYIVEDKDIQNLMDLYNRSGFTHNYFMKQNGHDMVSFHKPNHTGRQVGTVIENKKGLITIKLLENVQSQDVLEIVYDHECIYEFTNKHNQEKGNTISVNSNKGFNIKENMEVWKTKNNQLLKQLYNDYLNNNKKVQIIGKIELKLNKPSRLHIFGNGVETVVYGEIVTKAMKRPVTKEEVMKHIIKTGDTSFTFETLDIQADEHIFISVNGLKELRREALHTIEKNIIQNYYRKCEYEWNDTIQEPVLENHKQIFINVLVHTYEQMETIIPLEHINIIYLEISEIEIGKILDYAQKCHKFQKKIYIALPHICRKKVNNYIEEYSHIIFHDNIDGYLVRSLDEYTIVKECISKQQIMIADYSLYVMNHFSRQKLRELQFQHDTANIELNLSELKQQNLKQTEIIIYGYMPVMISAQCINNTIHKKCDKICKTIHIKDRYHKKFMVKNYCKFCYNIVYNSQTLYLLDKKKEILSLEPNSIRLQFINESREDMMDLIKSCINAYIYNGKSNDNISNITRGHMWRGVE